MKTKIANVENKMEGFIYKRYYFTEPYTYSLFRVDSKMARGVRKSYSVNSKIYNTLTLFAAVKNTIIVPPHK